MAKQYNVNIVGNLTNNDGVISGFSSNDYMTITNTAYVPQGGNWELVMCVTTGNTINDSNIYAPNPWEHGVYIGLNNGYFSYLVGDVGNGWLNPSQGYIATSYSVLTNTTYYLKVTCDINNSGYYFFHYSLDGQNWVQLLQCSSTNQVAVNPHDLGIGFSGSIDLNKCYLKINDTIAWQGATVISNVRTKIQLRHDTASNWSTVNPTLAEGEVGIETDTRKQKFGDGVTAWNNLPYDKGSTALQSITSSDVTAALGYTPVNKAGDTMSGNLVISTNNAYNESLALKNTFVNKNSAPSRNSFTWLPFKDVNDAIVAGMYLRDTTNERELRLRIDSRDGNNDGFCLGYDVNNVAYTYCPQSDIPNSIVTTIAKSKSQNGYYKLGNGLIIQWGTVASTTGTTGQVTLPTAFTSSDYQIAYGSSTNLSIGTTSQTTTNFDWKKASTNASINWIAVGY